MATRFLWSVLICDWLWYCTNLKSAARVGLTMIVVPAAAAAVSTARRVHGVFMSVPPWLSHGLSKSSLPLSLWVTQHRGNGRREPRRATPKRIHGRAGRRETAFPPKP